MRTIWYLSATCQTRFENITAIIASKLRSIAMLASTTSMSRTAAKLTVEQLDSFCLTKKTKTNWTEKSISLQIHQKLEMDDSNILHGGQNVVTWLASCPWSSQGLLSDPNHFQCGDLLLVSRPSEGHQSFLKRRDGEGPREASECRNQIKLEHMHQTD